MSVLASRERQSLASLGARGASTRRQLEDLIQRAIDALDAMDIDPDMEPDADGEDSDDREEDLCDTEAHFWPAVVGPQDCCPISPGRDRS